VGGFAGAILTDSFDYSLKPNDEVGLSLHLHQEHVFASIDLYYVAFANDDVEIFRLSERDHALIGFNRAPNQPHRVTEFHEMFVAARGPQFGELFQVSKVIGHPSLLGSWKQVSSSVHWY
jgi:hypothetical protein